MTDEPAVLPPGERPAAGAPALEPVDVDGVGAITYGTIAWSVALVVCLLLRQQLADAGRGWWLWVCVAGALLGLVGLVFVRRRAAVYRAGAAPEHAG